MRKGEASSSRISRILSGDPRRPAEAKKYERPYVDPEQQPQDPLLLVALMFGMIALILKVKLAAWFSLFSVAIAFANMRTDTADIKQFISSVTFALMGIVGSYIVPVSTEKKS